MAGSPQDFEQRLCYFHWKKCSVVSSHKFQLFLEKFNPRFVAGDLVTGPLDLFTSHTFKLFSKTKAMKKDYFMGHDVSRTRAICNVSDDKKLFNHYGAFDVSR